jgi:hypothetical protein
VTFLITKKVLMKRYDEILTDEIESMKEYYKEDSAPTEDENLTAKDYLNILRSEGYPADEVQNPESVLDARESMQLSSDMDEEDVAPFVDERVQRVFDKGLSAGEIIKEYSNDAEGLSFSDYKRLRMDDLKDKRSNATEFTEPYVIDKDEFQNECSHHDKLTLVYYDGDDTLVDETKIPIPPGGILSLVGNDALSCFGVGSGDDNIVYVRNARTGVETDFEIVRHDGAYTDDIQGLRDKPKLLRFREDD